MVEWYTRRLLSISLIEFCVLLQWAVFCVLWRKISQLIVREVDNPSNPPKNLGSGIQGVQS